MPRGATSGGSSPIFDPIFSAGVFLGGEQAVCQSCNGGVELCSSCPTGFDARLLHCLSSFDLDLLAFVSLKNRTEAHIVEWSETPTSSCEGQSQYSARPEVGHSGRPETRDSERKQQASSCSCFFQEKEPNLAVSLF